MHPDAGLLSTAQIVPQTTLSSGEIVILAIKPSVWFLVLVSVPWLLGAAGVILLAPWLESFSGSLMTQGALAVTAGRLIVALLQWSSRLYVLTNRRVMCYQGVVNVALFEAPLVQIRNTYLNSRPLEKLCKVGSIGFSLKGSKRVNAWWEQIANPVEVHERVRRAIEKALDHHSPL